jgi:dCMP deaminase
MTPESADKLWMDQAARCAAESHARRRKVGALIEKNGNPISVGWNGMPSGMDNNCEDELPDGTLITKPEVLHAELNALMKLTRSSGTPTDGATMYITLSPCTECAKLIIQSGIKRVVFKDAYRDLSGVELLKKVSVKVDHFVPS